MTSHWHTIDSNKLLADLNTTLEQGLSEKFRQSAYNKFGPNELPAHKKDSVLKKLLRQFSDILVIVLIIAAIVSFALHEKLDAMVIMLIVVVNGILGYVQEARAEQAIEALKSMSSDYAKVLREGDVHNVRVQELVPGDIILLESGDKVPADARLVEAISIEVSEAVLTGESRPVQKKVVVLSDETLAIGDRTNMLFKDTNVVYGRGKAVVVATGTNTEIGKISTLLQKQKDQKTPLGKELDVVGKRLSGAALVVILLIAIIGTFVRNWGLQETFLTSVSLAVAAIPEGLPAVVTIALAIGVSRLAQKKAIIRKLQAVETLGSTSYILTDKTGTLTENKMVVTDIATLKDKFDVITNPDESKILQSVNGHKLSVKHDPELMLLILNAVICNGAEIGSEKGETVYIGDSTETALLEAAHHMGLNIKEIREKHKEVHELPFSSDTKFMLVATEDTKDPKLVNIFVKGAPEVVQWMVKGNSNEITKINNEYATKGLRSLAFSYKSITRVELTEAISSASVNETLLKNHKFLGIMAQKDPIRREVKQALHQAKSAGIETIMITGDHKLTATSIAKELGLILTDEEAMNGATLGDTSGDKLENILKKVKVFARVSPKQKLNIVKAVKAQGYITAVTGDGVNDAPAIKAADIGISMGITGTDVSKEVSDMILQDDNYATIVEAIKQGRIVYDNLVKFITYLISCNISEILLIGTAMLVGPVLPLVPIQILWINLVTDGLPALSLGMEPGEKDIMKRHPRAKEDLLNKSRWLRMLYQALLITIATFVMFQYGLKESLVTAQTATLTTLAFAQLFHAFNSRSETHSIFSRDLASNQYLYLTVLVTALLQLGTVYTSIGNRLLKTAPLDTTTLGFCVLIALFPIVGSEIYKAINNKAVT